MKKRMASRPLVWGAAILSGMLAVSSCGTDATENGTSQADTAQAESSLLPVAEGNVSYPLTLETAWGSTVLEQRPEKIAAVTPSQDDVEVLAALGVTPYLASDQATDVWTEAAFDTPIPERFIRGDDPIPVEQIAAADPDLIIVLGVDLSEQFDQLSAIAPVLSVAQEGGSEASVANNWAESITRVGEVLDLENAAEQVLVDQEEFFADLRAKYPEFSGLSASYVVYYGADGGLQFHSSENSPAGLLLENMGFSLAPNADSLSYRQEISGELIRDIDADVLIFSGNSTDAYEEITDQPLFQSLTAVQDGNFIVVNNQTETYVIDGVENEGNLPWAFARSGPLSSTWAAEQLADVLAERIANSK